MALQEEFEEQGIWLFRYRGVLPLILLASGLLMLVWNTINPGILNESETLNALWPYVCFVIGVLGMVIRAYTVGHTPANTSGRNTEEQVADELNTTGIYSMVRHPLYVGNFFMWLPFALLTGNLWFSFSFVLVYWLYYERIMYAEEQFLRRKFGEKYTSWASTLPAFIPSFKSFKEPSLSFSWKKVLKKEKNTLASLFLLFSLFDIIRKSILGSSVYNWFFLIGAVSSLILYFILKYMKYNTELLNEEGR